MLYGVAYYHEYQPYERLTEDVRLMQEAGLSVVRLGESTWSSWEPEDGRFELAWMERIIDTMHAAGIKVVFGTPTYAIPPWLHRKHPEIMAQHAQGIRAWYGARQNMNLAHPTYLFYAERVIRKLVGHFAAHTAVVGYQVDNETSSGALHNPDVFVQFTHHLKQKFGSVECLNETWGLTYWSQRLADWSELWTPDGNTNTGYALEWRRFQASLITQFIGWQTGIVREYARPDQFITQNLVGGHGRPESDLHQIAQAVDILAVNPYHPTQDGLLGARSAPRAGLPQWMEQSKSEVEAGAWNVYEAGQMGRSGRQSNFLITELNAASIGDSHTNYPAYDGQWRLAVYAFISQGANMVAYWHWHSLHYGQETYWGGVLGHDLQPGRAYREISAIAHELQQHGDTLTDLSSEADVAVLYSQDSKYALEFQPPLPLPGSDESNHRSYQTIFDTFFRAFFDARAQTTIIHPVQPFEQYAVVVVPALYIADEALLTRLTRYAEGGGHLLLTFRSGYADEFNRVRPMRAPGLLRDAVGASYQEFSNLLDPLPVKSARPDFVLPDDAAAKRWVDGLQLEGAAALAYYEHPHFGQFPTIVSQPFGKGRVTYCGTLPNVALGKALAAWVMKQANIVPAGTSLPDSVRLHTARTRGGQRLAFYSNWSWDTHMIPHAGAAGHDLFTNGAVPVDGTLPLAAWDVKIVIED